MLLTYIYIYFYKRLTDRQFTWLSLDQLHRRRRRLRSHFANSSLAHRPSDSPTHSTAAAVTSHPSDDQDNKDSGFCSALGEEEEEEETLLHVDTAGSIIKQQWVASNPQLHRATPKAEKTPHRRKTTNTAQLLLTSWRKETAVFVSEDTVIASAAAAPFTEYEKKKNLFNSYYFLKKLNLVPRERWIQNKTVITLGWKFSFRTSFIRM